VKYYNLIIEFEIQNGEDTMKFYSEGMEGPIERVIESSLKHTQYIEERLGEVFNVIIEFDYEIEEEGQNVF
jgi:hypothetical protein